MSNRIRLFSNGFEADSWEEHNCDRCRKAARWHGDGNRYLCPIEEAIGMGAVTDGTATRRMAERMGWIAAHEGGKVPLVWDCPERVIYRPCVGRKETEGKAPLPALTDAHWLQREMTLLSGEWHSRVSGRWWTNNAVAVRFLDPFADADMEFVCGHADMADPCEAFLPTECKALTTVWDLHSTLPARTLTALEKLIRSKRRGAIPASFEDGVRVSASPDWDRLPLRTIRADDGRVAVVQVAYVAVAEQWGRPTVWLMAKGDPPQAAIVGLRGREVVAVMMPCNLPAESIAAQSEAVTS